MNSFGLDRRSALWQAERVIRPAGELLDYEDERSTGYGLQPAGKSELAGGRLARSEPPAAVDRGPTEDRGPWTVDRGPWAVDRSESSLSSPLDPMTASERLVADYAGTSMTIGPHPMSFRRHELSMRGIIPAIELPRIRSGRRVRTAGMVITRQRPGTAKGFVFLTLEDETGVANIIVQPDFFDQEKLTIVSAPFMIVEGIVQTVDDVTAIKAEKIFKLEGFSAESAIDSHDFH